MKTILMMFLFLTFTSPSAQATDALRPEEPAVQGPATRGGVVTPCSNHLDD